MCIEEKLEVLFLECQMNKELEKFETMDKYLTPIEEIEETTQRYYDLYDRIALLKNKE